MGQHRTRSRRSLWERLSGRRADTTATAHLSGGTRMLHSLPVGCAAVIDAVQDRADADAVAHRLRELGFVPGEMVRLVARGPIGGDPVAVQVGTTRFALRRAEAERVRVRLLEEPGSW